MRVPLRILVGAGLAFVLAGAFLLWQGLRHDEVRSPSRTPALPAFRLHTDEGPLSERDLAGHWTFLFFGYTQCPDACPSTFSTIKEISRALETQGASQPSVVFVSLDPARDTPQLLASYAHAFDPRFIGATGSEADLDPLTRALGIFYLRNDNGKAGRYSLDHTTNLYLIDPSGRLRESFPAPLDKANIVAQSMKLFGR